MNPSHREIRDQRGLTLLEVLAAAMIFAMVMTVLVSTSSTAVHRSGLAARRLEANLIADAFLADLEIQMKQRIAPEVDEGETTREYFAIVVEQRSFAGDAQGGADQAASLALAGAGGGSIASLLGAQLPEVAKHLMQYDITVSWFESDGPQQVTRTTFAFDWQAAAIEFADLFQGAPGLGDADAEGDQPELGDAESLEGMRPEDLP